jgi:carbon-monoxide dehydrogenase large subunit
MTVEEAGRRAVKPDEAGAAVAGAAFAGDEWRIEGRDKVTGSAHYAADIRLPGMLWAAHARSPIAHGRIVSVDTSAALAVPGVQRILTGADVRPSRIGRRLQDWPVLAWDRVRFIGDRVAVVAADSADAAEEAASRIEVEYEELPAVFDPLEALGPNAPILHADSADYVYLGGVRQSPAHPNIQGHHLLTLGDPDIERALAGCERVFEHEFSMPRQHQGHLEPHACVVWIDGDVVRVVSTNKGPFTLRGQLAASLGLAEDRIAIENRFIGGDFGGKGLSLDEYACYFLARETGRPVMAVMSFAAELQASNPRHAGRIVMRTGVAAGGRIVAHAMTATFDGGAYAAGKPGLLLLPIGVFASLGTYLVPNARLEATAVYTNSVPGGNMRSPGEVQALFAGESHIDMIAIELGLDPLDFRRRNAIADGQRTPAGELVVRPRVREVLDVLATEVSSRKGKPAPNRGIGVAIGMRAPASGHSTVSLRLRDDGRIEIVTGVPDQGAGTHTAIGRVAAAVLSVDVDRVDVRVGTTDSAMVDTGASGSRVTYHTSRAVEAGAIRLRAELERAAAEALGLDPGAVALRAGTFVVDRGVGRIERSAFDDVLGGVATDPIVATFDGAADERVSSADSVAGYVVEVEVDRGTGLVTIVDAVLVVDIGTIINPVAHRGQLEGGFVFGLGGALMEELSVVDGRVATVGLHDYKLPTTMDVPPLRTILLASDGGPGAFGAKMVGEVSNGPLAPAIANAVAAACGARLVDLPLSAERVFAALQAARSADPAARPTDPAV